MDVGRSTIRINFLNHAPFGGRFLPRTGVEPYIKTWYIYYLLYSGKLLMVKTFADCSLVPCQRMPHPQISWRKISQTATKPRNSQRFSPSKVSRYTVYCTYIWPPCSYEAEPCFLNRTSSLQCFEHSNITKNMQRGHVRLLPRTATRNTPALYVRLLVTPNTYPQHSPWPDPGPPSSPSCSPLPDHTLYHTGRQHSPERWGEEGRWGRWGRWWRWGREVRKGGEEEG